LVIVTALGVGMPKACAIWAALLGMLLLLGLVVSIKTDDWNFPGGSLLAIVALVALLGGLVAADLFVQAKWIKSSQGCGLTTAHDPMEPTCDVAGVYKFKKDTIVDIDQVRRGESHGKSICLAPIVTKSSKGIAADQVQDPPPAAPCARPCRPTHEQYPLALAHGAFIIPVDPDVSMCRAV